jgi:ParB/RepB/Spo0J family partition protein
MSNLQIEQVAPQSLRPYAGNARIHSKKQIKQIARSIERFGFTNPILVSNDREVIAGHGRLRAAQQLGLTSVPIVILATMSETDRRAYVLADNKLAENAGWDRDILAIELQGLLDVEFDDPELSGS